MQADLYWTPQGWQSRGAGDRWLIPGIPNLHSHAFQRAMAGLAERQTHPNDSFWTWRDTMYRMAERFDPESLHAVASQLYVEMLEAGYTTVCEFHYLHHATDGKTYDDSSAMSQALIAAARDTGIRMTLLPVLYMTGGFDGRALSDRQRRFGHSIDDYLRLLTSLSAQQDDRLRIGCALHSLRAVPPDAITHVTANLPQDTRMHIHIAEQTGEVDECIAAYGARPVQWLFDHIAVDSRWTLVHATHIDHDEVLAIARSGATVALCSTTEANLGDGIFPLRTYLDAGGAWGIGSDSQISVSPIEELRWLEYGQRLTMRKRNIAIHSDRLSVGEALLHDAVACGPQATGFPETQDYCVLDAEAPQLAGMQKENVIDRLVFSGNRNLIRDVVVAGERVVVEGKHIQRDIVAARFKKTMQALLQ